MIYHTDINFEIDAIIESLDARDDSMEVVYEGFKDVAGRVGGAVAGAAKSVGMGLAKAIDTVINAILRAINGLMNVFRKARGKETKEFTAKQHVAALRTKTFHKQQDAKQAAYYVDKKAKASEAQANIKPKSDTGVSVAAFLKAMNAINTYMGKLLYGRTKADLQPIIDEFYNSEEYKQGRDILDGKFKDIETAEGMAAEYPKAEKAIAQLQRIANRMENFKTYTNDIDGKIDDDAKTIIQQQMATIQSLEIGLINKCQAQFA